MGTKTRCAAPENVKQGVGGGGGGIVRVETNRQYFFPSFITLKIFYQREAVTLRGSTWMAIHIIVPDQILFLPSQETVR